MFPIIAIGGVIGAVMSIGKGVSWLADQLDSASNTTSTGSKGDAKTPSQTTGSAFEAALTAQIAGQKQPTAVTGTTSVASPVAVGTDHDTLARMQAGLLTYNYIGDRHDKTDTASATTAAP